MQAGESTQEATNALLDAVRRHDADAASRLIDGGTLAVDSLAVSIDDPDEVRALLADVFTALPDLSVQTVRTFAGTNQLAVELVLSGTMTGELRGTPPTGRAAELFGRAIIDLTGERRSISLVFDRDTAMEQLGLQADPPPRGRNDGAGLRTALLDDRWWAHPDTASAAVAPAAEIAPVHTQATSADPAVTEPASGEPANDHASHDQAGRRRSRRVGIAVIAVATVGAIAVGAGVALMAADANDPVPPTAAAAALLPPVADVAPAPDPVITATPTRWTSSRLFVIGSTQLAPEADAAIARLADRIRATGDAGTVTVTGYTDNVGSEQLNVDLSEQRAQAVGAALTTELASTGWVVSTVGAGPADPLVPNTTYANQAKNRRIEAVYQTSPE